MSNQKHFSVMKWVNNAVCNAKNLDWIIERLSLAKIEGTLKITLKTAWLHNVINLRNTVCSEKIIIVIAHFIYLC